VRLALQRNPELASFAKEMRALEGVTLQAGLLRNPELVVNVENAGNVQKLQGDINSSHAVAQEVVQQISTIRINQLIELGGKRPAGLLRHRWARKWQVKIMNSGAWNSSPG